MSRTVRDLLRSAARVPVLAIALLFLLPACGGALAAAPGAKADSAPSPGYPSEEAASADMEMSAQAPMAAGAMPAAEPPPGAMAPSSASPAPAPARRPAPSPAGAPTLAKGPSDPPPTRAKQGDPAIAKRPAATVAQMLIYTASFRMRVEQDRFAETVDRIVDLAVAKGGYLSTHDNASVQVRVPSTRFRELLKDIETLGEVTHRAVQAQDVTEQYYDLAIRLKSLKATRDRLEQFLGRAKSIQEVLSVEKELTRVNGEIDRIEGRMRFLASRAAFSTVTVSLEAKPKTVIVDDDDGHPPPPPRTIALPIEWLSQVGLDRLLRLD